MQYRGRIPQCISADDMLPLPQSMTGPSTAAELDPCRARQRQLEQRFECITSEIAEREEFMRSMQQLGKFTAEHKTVIVGEIAVKVKELEGIDEELKGLQAKAAGTRKK